MVTLSTPPLTVLIPSGDAEPGGVGELAWACKVRDSSLGRTEGWVTAHHGVGVPVAEVWWLYRPVCLGNRPAAPFQTPPGKAVMTSTGCPAARAWRTAGTCTRKSPPTGNSHIRVPSQAPCVGGTITGPAQLLGRLRPRGSGDLPGMPRGSPLCPLWTDLPLLPLQVQPRLAGGPLLQGHQHRHEVGWRQ